MSDPSARLQRALEGRYRIQRGIGEGGMATVYLAEDLKHDRMVALKVLRPELAAVVGAQRFLTEIKTTANLQHPHILPLFESGEADGLLYYVMPHVAGESLRARLDREHQLPVAEAVRIATAVAHALDYAHRHGVIHRDIKPANILLQDGEPVVADFGIALAVSTAGGGRLTETGLSLGTPHYMSPEQATGDQSIGASSDIYALGCVLYETLVGDPPHVGSTAQAVLSRILTEEPEAVTARRKAVPANVDHAIRKALEKVPADRFGSAREFGSALADPGFRHIVGAEADVRHSVRDRRSTIVATAGWCVAAVVSLWWALTALQPAATPWINRFDIGIPTDPTPTALAVSPDGRTVLYAAGGLFRRPLEALHADSIPGTQGAVDVSVSPDGQWAAFSQRVAARHLLKKIRLSGGPALELAEYRSQIRGFAWDSMQSLIVGSHDGGLFRVPVGGGTSEPLTQPAGGPPHRYPRVLPGRRGVLFHIGGSLTGDQVAVLPTGESQWRVLTAGTDAHYVSGYLVFYRDGSLWAAPFDLEQLELRGEPVPVLASIGRLGVKTVFEWSGNGNLFYIEPARRSQRIVWVNRDGSEQQLSTRGLEAYDSDPNAQFQRAPVLSPDGTMMLVLHVSKLWVHGLRRGVWERLTGDAATEWFGIWSPDGAEVFFTSRRSGPFDMYRISLTGPQNIRVVGTEGGRPLDWTPDGSGLLYSKAGLRVWWLREERSELLLESVVAAQLSPNGRYLASQLTDAAGANHIEVRPFPDMTSNRWRMPSIGATEPKWSADGNELYYLVSGAIVAVSVNAANAVPFGSPVQILDGPFLHYEIAGDGRFLVVQEDATARSDDGARVIVVQNWLEELKRLVPPAGNE